MIAVSIDDGKPSDFRTKPAMTADEEYLKFWVSLPPLFFPRALESGGPEAKGLGSKLNAFHSSMRFGDPAHASQPRLVPLDRGLGLAFQVQCHIPNFGLVPLP